MKTTERRVSYWAVQGDRWCNVDGMIDAAKAREWAEGGWRIVTRVTESKRPIFGELEEKVDE